MDFSSAMDAVLLGVVEGFTEFLPISSTGHLILAAHLLGFEGPHSKLFEVVIQLGAILAVCWLYRARLWQAVLHVHDDPLQQRFARNIIVAFLPAVVIGLLAHGYIKAHLFNPFVVSVELIIGGIIILWIEHLQKNKTPRVTSIDQFNSKLSFGIGLAQTLAMIPGVSRAGATIMGALLLGADRKSATEFSFFLAIPTMLGATFLDLYKARGDLNGTEMEIIAVGFIAAFFSALVVVKGLIGFVSRYGFAPFAWYRILLGSLALWLIFA